MSTFHAISASKVLELFPWISIWFGEDSAANSLMIVRWKRMDPVYFPTSIDWNRWKAGRIAKQTDCDSVHTRIGCKDPNLTSIDWNCQKSRIAKQTDCDSVHTRIGCKDPNLTSIDWNCQKSRIAKQRIVTPCIPGLDAKIQTRLV